jgi:hypothetical protein
MIKYKFMLLLLTGVFAFASCSRETEVEDPFTGRDSYITAFSLKQGELVFKAAIIDREIVVTVPEGFSLTQAQATVKLSENATIYPDPAGITDWNEERQFAVTAYNSGQIRYKYTVKRRGLAHEGTVILETQADVEAFGQQGLTLIDGSLTIGRATGADSITSLAPLTGLKEVGYNITLNPTCAITGLEGLESLEYVGGTFQSTALKRLEILRLPALKTAGSFSLQNTVTIIAEFPELVRVSKEFNLNCPLYQLQLPALQFAGTLTLTTVNNSGASLAKLSLPKLEETDKLITAYYFHSLTRIEMPLLKKTGGMTFQNMNLLSFIYAPRLEEITNTFRMLVLASLSEVEMPALKRIGTLYVDGAPLKVLELPKLVEMDAFTLYSAALSEFSFPELQKAGTLYINSPTLNIPRFPKLSEVVSLTLGGTSLTEFRLPELQKAGTLALSGAGLSVLEFPKLSEINDLNLSNMSANALDGFPSLQSVGNLLLGDLNYADRLELSASIQRIGRLRVSVNSNNSMPPGEINVTGKNIDILELLYIPDFKLVGDEVFHGTLITNTAFPQEIEGFREVDSLNVQIGYEETARVHGIRKVNRGAYLSGAYGYPTRLSISDLEETGGTFIINCEYMFNSTATVLEVEKLKRVGGDLSLNILTGSVKTLSFPYLETVGGSLNLISGYDYSQYAGFETLNFPKLTAVGGKLTIHSGSTSRNNQQLKNLDGFAALTGVGSIEISRQEKLESYEGLKELFKTLPEESWITPTYNGYNPSWQELKEQL